tara:strand:+ start:693 stop:908 length:216 start_codon:yes stop_codon:yes gene_type:complete
MATFEYMQIFNTDMDLLVQSLNKMGEQGWRVLPETFDKRSRANPFAKISRANHYWVLMEREIQNQSDFNKS